MMKQAESRDTRQQRSPRTIYRTIHHVLLHVTEKLLFAWLRAKHRPAVAEIAPFSLYLEREVFPILRNRDTATLCLSPDPETGRLTPGTIEGVAEFPPHDAGCLVRRLDAAGIRRIDLDTTLESGQIVEMILILLYTHTALGSVTPSDTQPDSWKRGRIASAMVGANGYNKFCARIRFDRTTGVVAVTYEYCPLPLSRFTQRYMGLSRFNDHRALFRLAPRASVLVLLLFAFPAAMTFWHVKYSLWVTGVLAVVCAFAVGTIIKTIGAILYDKEHYESLKQKHLEKITHLSRFPAVNPQPIIELKVDGTVVYTNPSAEQLLKSIGRTPEEANEILPGNILELVDRSLCAPSHVYDAEHSISDRVLRYWFSVFPEDMTVIASAADLTELKSVENELRTLNEGLESRVRERTEEIAQTQDAAILCLAGLAETRDPETGRHLDRTRHYVLILCEQLRTHERFSRHLSAENIQLAFKSAPLHDIGKVGVPDAVLLKPGKLTDEEFKAIKQHPIHGGDALSIAEQRLGFNSFLSMGKDIAYYHHERWDGKGYPYGKRGDDIPWPARLMAVADVYDALTSRRPYKEPWSHADACDEICRNRGSQFDPDVVDAFFAAEDRFAHIAQLYAEPGEVVRDVRAPHGESLEIKTP